MDLEDGNCSYVKPIEYIFSLPNFKRAVNYNMLIATLLKQQMRENNTSYCLRSKFYVFSKEF